MTTYDAGPFGAHGERLSIIIPTYNCARYLEETLRSLQIQPGDSLRDAQILVVDDHSTKDNPEVVVDQIAPGRVRFVRHEKNLGPCANFNACLDLAEREWIHILHGDDYVRRGAYEEFATCISSVPNTVAVFGRSVQINAEGQWIGVSTLLGPGTRGRLVYDPRKWASNPIWFPGALISRAAIDLVGTFDCTFSHVQDWNLWWRIARTGRVAYTNKCVAAYREFDGNHTSSLLSSGKNIAEFFDQIGRLEASMRDEANSRALETALLYEDLFHMTLQQCRLYLGDPKPFEANFRMFKRFPTAVVNRRKIWTTKIRHYEALLKKRRRRERESERPVPQT